MKIRISTRLWQGLPLAVLLASASAIGQVPVDDDGNVLGEYADAGTTEKFASNSEQAPTGNEDIPLLTSTELEELVGPVALYPDDLLAIVLPAATYPLQVVQAARFLQDLETNPALEPNPEWDDSVIALVNYPEVVKLLNDDLDWTWRLGEAVVAQQIDVINAVENFRDRAYAAGNLKSDSYQTVSRDEGIIEITPVSEDVIYVPYYEPERVVYYQPRPVYYYYPRAYPVYYYPYPSHYAFNRGYFWGVTTAFSIGWTSNHLHVFHHSYRGHPYYGRSYYDRWWYRRPDIHVHNNVYIRNNVNVSVNRYNSGDYWRPSRNTRLRSTDQRITRNTHFPSQRAATNNGNVRNSVNSVRDRNVRTSNTDTSRRNNRQQQEGFVRNNSRDDMRESIATVQRERQASGQSVRRQATRETTNRRQSAQRDTAQRNTRQSDTAQRNTRQTNTADRSRATQRQPSERRNVSQNEIAERLAMQRNTRDDRRSSNRTTVQRQTTARQPVQRESAQQRQTSQRQTVQRQSVQRQPVQRESSQRQTAQRQSVERQSAQRQTVQRQSTQRQSSSERRSQSSSQKSGESSSSRSGNTRSASSSNKSRSARDNSRRR